MFTRLAPLRIRQSALKGLGLERLWSSRGDINNVLVSDSKFAPAQPESSQDMTYRPAQGGDININIDRNGTDSCKS